MSEIDFNDSIPEGARRGGIIGFLGNATPSRKILLSIGTVTFVAGLVLLVVGVMSALDSGDNRPQPAVIDITPSPVPATPAPATEGPTPAPTPVPTPPLPNAGYQLVIDRLGVEGPVQEYGLDENAIPIVPEGDDAATVIAWYNFSARPGTGSNAVFAGHVTWFGAAVFYNLSSTQPGDKIRLLSTTDGTELVYNVSDVYQVSATDPEAVNVMKSTPEDVITIITCDGVFTADPNDDVAGGSYDNRLVVRAQLETLNGGAAVSAGG